MGWKTSWNKQDPIEKRRRELDQQAVSISRQKAALESELLNRDLGLPEEDAQRRPTVWVEHQQESFTKEEEWQSRSGRPPVLSVHRYRDRNLFLALASVLLVVVIFLIRAALH